MRLFLIIFQENKEFKNVRNNGSPRGSLFYFACLFSAILDTFKATWAQSKTHFFLHSDANVSDVIRNTISCCFTYYVVSVNLSSSSTQMIKNWHYLLRTTSQTLKVRYNRSISKLTIANFRCFHGKEDSRWSVALVLGELQL
jgi:hypothetical protein